MTNNKPQIPKVSVLIPVFNRKEYIAECIQSAIDQTFKDFEVVVVDNASDDGTWEICQKFAAVDQRVRIFRNESNIGPVRNWLRCAQEAKGEFSKILFSDDSLEPNCLNEMVPKLENPDIGLVYCAALIGTSKDDSMLAYSQTGSSQLTLLEFFNLVFSGNAPVSPGAVLIRTADLLKNLHISFSTSTPRNFEKNGAGPDVMILLLTAKDYRFITNIELPLVYFRAHSGSFSIQNINNDITNGYRSVFSYFSLKYFSRKYWFYYLAKSWLQVMLFSRRWRSPSAHLIEFEGSGKLNEIFILQMLAMVQVVKFIYRRTFVFVCSLKSKY